MRKILFLAVCATIAFIGCNDDGSDGKDGNGTLSVRLIDAPADYQEVLIDLQELYIHLSNDSNDVSGWQQLDLDTAGQIDLLKLTNGNDLLLTEEDLPAGKISQMRMILGENNQLMIDSVLHELSTPSAQQSGLKFNIHATLEPGVTYRMWIDFDAAKSIVKKGNGTYSLKPTIKVFTEESASIKGTVSPTEAMPLIQAVSGDEDTTSTYANDSGEFLIPGLVGGTYTVIFTPTTASGYLKKDTTGISTIIGSTTDIGTIVLTK